jgi:hypothetical protein
MSTTEPSPVPSRNGLVDTAIVLALGTGALYSLAYCYWNGYLSFFGAADDFLDLRIENIVAPVLLVGMILGICVFSLMHLVGTTLNAPDLRTVSIPALAPVLLGTVAAIASLPYRTPFWAYWVVLAASILLAVLVRHRRFTVEKFLGDRYAVLTLAPFAILVVAGIFNRAGSTVAAKLAQGEGDNRVRVELRSPLRLPADLVLVGHMGTKYLFCEPKNPNPLPEAIIIDSSDIVKLTTYRKP